MKILLDMDGFLVDFVGGVCRWHTVPNPYDNPKNHGIYDIEKVIGIHGAEFWNPLGEEFWATLEPMPQMLEIIDIFTRLYGQDNLCLLTQPILTPGCIDGKMRWIKKYLPAFRRRFLIGPAKEFCAHADSILFDDSERNISKFEAAGGNALLVPGLWNRKHNLDPLEEVRRFIREN